MYHAVIWTLCGLQISLNLSLWRESLSSFSVSKWDYHQAWTNMPLKATEQPCREMRNPRMWIQEWGRSSMPFKDLVMQTKYFKEVKLESSLTVREQEKSQKQWTSSIILLIRRITQWQEEKYVPLGNKEITQSKTMTNQSNETWPMTKAMKMCKLGQEKF